MQSVPMTMKAFQTKQKITFSLQAVVHILLKVFISETPHITLLNYTQLAVRQANASFQYNALYEEMNIWLLVGLAENQLPLATAKHGLPMM